MKKDYFILTFRALSTKKKKIQAGPRPWYITKVTCVHKCVFFRYSYDGCWTTSLWSVKRLPKAIFASEQSTRGSCGIWSRIQNWRRWIQILWYCWSKAIVAYNRDLKKVRSRFYWINEFRRVCKIKIIDVIEISSLLLVVKCSLQNRDHQEKLSL